MSTALVPSDHFPEALNPQELRISTNPELVADAQLVADDMRGHESEGWDTIAQTVIAVKVAQAWTLMTHPRYRDKKQRRAFVWTVMQDLHQTADPKKLASYE